MKAHESLRVCWFPKGVEKGKNTERRRLLSDWSSWTERQSIHVAMAMLVALV